jgi:hypothetical protein
MSWRKWLVRGIVFFFTAGLAAAGFCYQRWTNPEAVRQQVIERLGALLVGATVSLDSAQFQLLGGISVMDVRLSRRDDPSRAELAYIPSATIYHDKEKLLDGKIVIRKIELQRPRLHVRREADGRWNTANILGVPHPDDPIPTIVVKQATIYLEDRLAGAGQPAVEINGVDFIFWNDPIEKLNFQGNGKAAIAGILQMTGSWNRRSDDTTLALKASGVSVCPELLNRLEAYSPQLHTDGQQLSGTATVQADLAYHSSAAQPWTHSVRWQLTDGHFAHPNLPLPLDDLECSGTCSDGRVTLDGLRARAQTATIKIEQCTLQSLNADADLDLALSVAHLPLTDELFKRLPANFQKVHHDFAPLGPVSLQGTFARRNGRWIRHCIVHLEGLTTTFFEFPYPVEHVTGALEQDIDPFKQVDVVRVDLVGLAGAQRAFIKGDVTGDGPDSAVNLKIWGQNLAIDEKMHTALPKKQDQLARSFHPSGTFDVEAYVRRAERSRKFANRYVIRFHNATARYDVFPYPLEEVNGVLDIQPEHWEFSDFRGTHKGGEVHVSGRSNLPPNGDRLQIQIDGDRIVLDPELEAALNPELKQTWKIFGPTGSMKFHADVNCLPNTPPDVDVRITATGCGIKPSFFPYHLHELTGMLHYAHGAVDLEELRARHGPTVLSLDKGRVLLKPEQQGGFWADIDNLQGSPLVFDGELLDALPGGLREVCQMLELRDAVGVRTHLTIDSPSARDSLPVIFWDGQVTLADARVHAGVALEHLRGKAACRGRYSGQELEGLLGNLHIDEATILNQPFRDIQGQVEVKKKNSKTPNGPNILAIRGLRSRVFGGEVYGNVGVELDSPPRYELNLMASQVKLEELGRHNVGRDAQVSGQATGQLYLTGRGPDMSTLSGHGVVDVPSGRLYSLPLLLDLLKFLGLRLPDGTAFEEAHAAFAVRGKRVAVSRLDLYGNAVSLRGQGEMNLDGTDINLDFYAVWARVIQFLPPLIKDIPPYISQQLLKIKMRGAINNVQLTKEPVPVLVEPLKDLLDRVSGRSSSAGR